MVYKHYSIQEWQDRREEGNGPDKWPHGSIEAAVTAHFLLCLHDLAARWFLKFSKLQSLQKTPEVISRKTKKCRPTTDADNGTGLRRVKAKVFGDQTTEIFVLPSKASLRLHLRILLRLKDVDSKE